MSALARARRALLLPATVAASFVVLGAGVGLSFRNGNLTGVLPADAAAAEAAYTPATGLGTTAPVPAAREVGGAGALEPADRPVSLAVEVSGVVDAVLVAEGATVAAGDPLLRLRGAPAAADRAAAEAEARAARADRAAAGDDAAAAEARAALSATAAQRAQALAPTGAATPDELDRALRTRDADAATAAASRARARQAEARVAAADARVALATAREAQLTLRAPTDGEVLQVLLRAGEATSPTQAALVLGDTRQLRARVDINERDATRVAPGQPARVRVEGSDTDLPGRVVEVARRVGRKNVRTEDPTERQDARFVETVIALDAAPRLPIGIRVQGFIQVDAAD
jgi:multidrug resistance efflux pump